VHTKKMITYYINMLICDGVSAHSFIYVGSTGTISTISAVGVVFISQLTGEALGTSPLSGTASGDSAGDSSSTSSNTAASAGMDITVDVVEVVLVTRAVSAARQTAEQHCQLPQPLLPASSSTSTTSISVVGAAGSVHAHEAALDAHSAVRQRLPAVVAHLLLPDAPLPLLPISRDQLLALLLGVDTHSAVLVDEVFVLQREIIYAGTTRAREVPSDVLHVPGLRHRAGALYIYIYI
jgi:hypothetical protein